MIEYKSPPIHRTPRYRAKAAYYGMLDRCGDPKGLNPTYADVELRMTLEEWMEWAIPRYEKFIEENPNVSPSVSRYGDKGHYEFTNIEIVSLKENRARQKIIGKKGTIPWNKGKTKETDPSVAETAEKLKDKPKSEEHKKNLSLAIKEYHRIANITAV